MRLNTLKNSRFYLRSDEYVKLLETHRGELSNNGQRKHKSDAHNTSTQISSVAHSSFVFANLKVLYKRIEAASGCKFRQARRSN